MRGTQHIHPLRSKVPTTWIPADLRSFARTWFFVMRSPYWGRFIAFYKGHCEHGIILQAADPDAMKTLMNRVAPPYWQDDRLLQLPPARPSHTADLLEMMAALPSGGGGR
jgi:hypothetical protein